MNLDECNENFKKKLNNKTSTKQEMLGMPKHKTR